MSSPSAPRWARCILGSLSWLVPGEVREEWRREWEAELHALAESHHARETPTRPGMVAFVAGALPHALSMRMEGWSFDGVAQDFRYGLRALRRSPGFTWVAALTLALGIGANGAIFSLVNGILFRSPPGIAEPGRLVQVARSYDRAPRWDNWSWPALQLIGREGSALSGVAGYESQDFVLGRGERTAEVTGAFVSGGYFGVLGVRPYLGRLIGPSDDVTPGAHPVVVLGYRLWRHRFGGEPDVVGRSVSLGSEPYQVIGVAPPGFSGPGLVGARDEIWVPAMQVPPFRGGLPFDRWGYSWINAVGRLRPGVSLEEARASMDLVTARLRAAADVNEDIRVLLAPGVGLSPSELAQARRLSVLLMGIVGLVLLITCTNVANLCLARGEARSTEVAVRMALGAGRARLSRQLLAESFLLTLLAALLALPIVYFAGGVVPLVLPYTLSAPVTADRTVYAFLALAALAAGVLFGVAPAWAASSGDVSAALRESRSAGGRGGTRLRDALVVVQLALSVGLVAGAALLGRSVWNARSADPGFTPRGLVAGFVDLAPTGRYDETTGRALFRRLLASARAIPGVRAVTLASETPITGGHSRASVRPSDDPDERGYEAELTVVGPDYFKTMGIPVLEGRTLRGLDDEPEPVVVVNRALERMFWPGKSAVGKHLDAEKEWRIVGVVGDVQMRSLRAAPRPAVYYPLSQAYSSLMALHVRADRSSADLFRSLREAVATVDPALPVSRVVDLQDALADSMGETHTIAYLLALFGALALILASVGLYGLVSFGVSLRVREIGIRIALGARPRLVVRLILARGFVLTMFGLSVGLALSVAFGHALARLLFAVTPTDVPSLAIASSMLLATATLAAWFPARRASKVDAAVSLREE